MKQVNYKLISIKYENYFSAYIKSDNFPSGIPMGTLIECAKIHPLEFSIRAIKSKRATSIEMLPNGTPFVLTVPSDGRILWVKGLLNPCLFLAIAVKDEKGYYREAVYGHFSARSMTCEYGSLCDTLKINSKSDVEIRLSGYAGRASHDTLEESVQKLCLALKKKGLNVNHEFDDEKAIVTDGNSKKVVSDLGLDIGGKKRYSRRFLWGIGRDTNILFSFIYEPDRQIIHHVTIIQ